MARPTETKKRKPKTKVGFCPLSKIKVGRKFGQKLHYSEHRQSKPRYPYRYQKRQYNEPNDCNRYRLVVAVDFPIRIGVEFFKILRMGDIGGVGAPPALHTVFTLLPVTNISDPIHPASLLFFRIKMFRFVVVLSEHFRYEVF